MTPVKHEHSRMYVQLVGHCERKAVVKPCLVVRGLLSLAKDFSSGIIPRCTCPCPRLLPEQLLVGQQGGTVSAESCPQEASAESRADVAKRQARLAPARGTC